VVVGGLIFVSGQASVDQAGNIVSDTFEGEFRRSIENIRKVLEAAGSDLAHVVQTRNYVRDGEDMPLYNQLYREYFPQPSPARTTITNCCPPRYAMRWKWSLCGKTPTLVSKASSSAQLAAALSFVSSSSSLNRTLTT